MASLTSTQSGDHNVAATWGGATFADGDIVTISAGHTVNFVATATIGAAGIAGTLAATVIGTLNVVAPLTVRGDISHQQTGTVIVSTQGSNTGAWTFFPPSGVTYKWTTVLTGSGTPVVNFAGEAGDYVTVTTNLSASGSRAYFDFTQGINPPTIAWSYVSMPDWGGTGDTTSTRALSYLGIAGCSVSMAYCRFGTNIGKLNFDMSGIGSFSFDMKNCDFRTPRNSTFLNLSCDTTKTGGIRRIKDCTFHHTSSSSVAVFGRDVTVEGGVWSNTKISGDIADVSNRYAGFASLWNVVINGMVSGRGGNGIVVEDAFFGVDQSSSSNPHYCVFNLVDSGGKPTIMRRNVCDGFGSQGADSGDFAIAAGSVIVERNIMMNQAGVLLPVVDTSVRSYIRRNTQCNAGGSTNAGESVGQALAIRRFTSNLFVDDTAGIHQDAVFVSQSEFVCDYNGFYNMTTAGNVDHPTADGGSPVNSYLGAATFAAWRTDGATYGTTNGFGLHDIYGDPAFVDKTRTAITWYNTIFGSGGSFSNVRAELLKLNGTDASGTASSPTAGVTPDALVAYLRAGFTPTNFAYARKACADDGVGVEDIGAIDFSDQAHDDRLSRRTIRPRAFAPGIAR